MSTLEQLQQELTDTQNALDAAIGIQDILAGQIEQAYQAVNMLERERDAARAERDARVELTRLLADFNALFAQNGLPECSNCKSVQEVLKTVQFLFDHIGSIRHKLVAVKRALSETASTAPESTAPESAGKGTNENI